MSRRIELQPHLSTHELYERYCACRKPNKKARWRALYLISRGTLAAAAARRVGRTSGWVTQLTQRYNERVAEAVPDRRGAVRPGRRHASRAWPRNSTPPCALLRPTAGCGRRRRSRLGSRSAPARPCMRRRPSARCAASALASRCHDRATPAPPLGASRRGLKKAEGHGLGAAALAPRGGGRSLGRGRSPPRSQADPAPRLGATG